MENARDFEIFLKNGEEKCYLSQIRGFEAGSIAKI